MRHTAVLLLGIGLYACSTPDPAQVQILHDASDFGARREYQLIAPYADMPGAEATLLAESLQRSLARHGYRQGGGDAPLLIQYRLTSASQPLTYPVDVPPPSPLGPYQAIHRFEDVRGLLHLRVTDRNEQLLWEGAARTELSPERQRQQQIDRAVDALVQKLPVAR